MSIGDFGAFAQRRICASVRERPRLAFARQRRLEQKRTPDRFLSLLSSFPKQLILAHGAGAPSPPSEKGGGCLRKGFEQADGGRDTVSMCESSRHSQQQKQMTAFSFGARLHLGANSTLALSLPQSRRFNPFSPRQLCPLAVLRSCFGYSLSHLRTAAACLSRCIRHRRRSKAKPLRGSRGGSAVNRTDLILLSKFGVNAVTGRGYNPSGFSACFTSRKASSPCTREPRTLSVTAVSYCSNSFSACC